MKLRTFWSIGGEGGSYQGAQTQGAPSPKFANGSVIVLVIWPVLQ